MNNQHPIFPPLELRNQWHSESLFKSMGPSVEREDYMINCAAQWGADQELEACCEWLSNRSSLTEVLRLARRPKPPSLREQALSVLDDVSDQLDAAHENTLRRALEALPND
jgi:hypothetical protein